MTNIQPMQPGNNDGSFCPMWDDDDSALFYNQTFDVLEIPKLELKNPPQHEYIIYSSKTEFKTVQANTALEAMESCGIATPHKIIHTGSRLACIIGSNKLKQAEQEEEQPGQTAERNSSPPEDATATQQHQAETATAESTSEQVPPASPEQPAAN